MDPRKLSLNDGRYFTDYASRQVEVPEKSYLIAHADELILQERERLLRILTPPIWILHPDPFGSERRQKFCHDISDMRSAIH